MIDLRWVGDVLRREVLDGGRALYQSDPAKVLAWEASAMARYGHYREEIRGILEDFRNTADRLWRVSEETAAQKIASLQRCVSQARVALSTAGPEFKTHYLLQDAAVLNIIRACETAIDLANMIIRKKRLGIPTESRESFGILVREPILDPGLGGKLQKMVGFRNLAVHRYRDLDMDVVQAVIQRSLDDILAFAKIAQPHLS